MHSVLMNKDNNISLIYMVLVFELAQHFFKTYAQNAIYGSTSPTFPYNTSFYNVHTWYYCSTVEDNIKLLEEVPNWSKEDTLVLQRLSFHISFPVNYINNIYLQLGKLCISLIIYCLRKLCINNQWWL